MLKSFKAHLDFTYNIGSVYPFLVYGHSSPSTEFRRTCTAEQTSDETY